MRRGMVGFGECTKGKDGKLDGGANAEVSRESRSGWTEPAIVSMVNAVN
jgi:hypothetical protein